MRKISKTIAVLLALVMISGSFTGCFTYAVVSAASGLNELIVFTIPLDIVTLPIQLVYLIVKAAQDAARNKRGKKLDGIDTFSAAVSSLPQAELDSLTQKINSLPQTEADYFSRKFNSLPPEELASFTEAVNSFSEEEIAAMLTTFNNLSPAEIASSIETFNSMPEENLIAMLNDLQKVEFCYQNKRNGQ